VKILENDTITRYIIDLKNENNPIRTFSKHNTMDYYSSLLYSDSSLFANLKYIWLTKFQVTRLNFVLGKTRSLSHLTVYDKETFTQISFIDTDFKLNSQNFRVINNGNAVLMLKEELNEFVIFSLQSNKIQSFFEFSELTLENKDLELTIDGF